MHTTAAQHTESSLDTESIQPYRAMPERLVMVRHGQSDANLINKAMRAGELNSYPEGFTDIPDREIRLTEQGREQARITGKWLNQEYYQGFDLIYTSDHTRAKETAALICQSAGWHDVRIRIDPLLGERNWGRFALSDDELRERIMNYRMRDPLHTPMPDGETLLETRHRSRELLDRAAREFSGLNVLVISHGEFIEALWSEIAHMNTERQLTFFHSPAGDIKNCQVVEFGSTERCLDSVRSSCPQAGINGEWEEIERISYSPLDLIEQVERYPNLAAGFSS